MVPAFAVAATPSFDCAQASAPGEKLVCEDEGLATLDRQLADVYRAARAKAGAGSQALEGGQRAWLTQRNALATPAALQTSYERRISALQAEYALVAKRGPFSWICDVKQPNVVVITYYESLTPAARIQFRSQNATLFVSPSGSGAKYAGQNVTFWEHQGEARVTWGVGGTAMTCRIDA